MKFYDLISADGETLQSRVQLCPTTITPERCHWAQESWRFVEGRVVA